LDLLVSPPDVFRQSNISHLGWQTYPFGFIEPIASYSEWQTFVAEDIRAGWSGPGCLVPANPEFRADRPHFPSPEPRCAKPA